MLTINGAAKLAVRDGEAFQKLLELADWIETAEAIQEGIEATDRGEGRPADEVFAEIRHKHNLPPAK